MSSKFFKKKAGKGYLSGVVRVGDFLPGDPDDNTLILKYLKSLFREPRKMYWSSLKLAMQTRKKHDTCYTKEFI